LILASAVAARTQEMAILLAAVPLPQTAVAADQQAEMVHG
jgi:hypothetical protein